MITDPIADFLIRIKNGYRVGKKKVRVPFSKIKEKLAEILVRCGYLQKVKKEKDELILFLKYVDGVPVLEDLRRVSKPGCRIYKKAREIKPVQSGIGVAIISTPGGLMTDREARKRKIGGEVICEIW